MFIDLKKSSLKGPCQSREKLTNVNYVLPLRRLWVCLFNCDISTILHKLEVNSYSV